MTSHSVFICLCVLIYPEVHLCVEPVSVFVCMCAQGHKAVYMCVSHCCVLLGCRGNSTQQQDRDVTVMAP